MSGAYEVYPSKYKFALVSFVAAAACAFCLHIYFNQEPDRFYTKWQFVFKDTHQAALVCLAIFIPFLLFSLKNLFSSRPVIVINGEGVYDSRHTKETIPWNGILGSGCQTIEFSGADLHVLALELTEYQRSNTGFKLFYYINAPFYKSSNPNVVCFHLNGLDFEFDELEYAIHAQRHARQMPVKTRSRSQRLFN